MKRTLIFASILAVLGGCGGVRNVGDATGAIEPRDVQQADAYRTYLPQYLHLPAGDIRVQPGSGVATVTILNVYLSTRRREIADQITQLNAQYPQLDPLQVQFVGKEVVDPNPSFPGSDWVLGDHQGDARTDQELYEFVAPGQTVDQWSRMLSCQRQYVGPVFDLRAAMERMRASLKSSNPDTQWNFIQMDDGIGYEWRHAAGNGQPAQDEVGRMVYRDGMVYRFACVFQTQYINEITRMKALELVARAKWDELSQ